MAPTIVLITGASRGLGRGLAQRFLAKPDHVVIAANRDPSGATSTALQELPKGQGSQLIIVKLDSAVEADAIEAVKTLETQGIYSLDIVVANAAISEVYPAVSDVNASDLQRHITINVLGVIWLYQAVLPLLRKSPNSKWVTMGSGAGAIEVGFSLGACGSDTFMYLHSTSNQRQVIPSKKRMYPANQAQQQPPIPNGAYGPSKAMVHWYTKRINAEEPVTAFVADPGFTNTDMGSRAAGLLGLPRAPDEPDDSCDGILRLIEEATKETHGGKLIHYKGDVQPW